MNTPQIYTPDDFLRDALNAAKVEAKPEVNETLEALKACHRRMVQATAVLFLSLGFGLGMAAVAIPLFFGAT